MKGAVENKSKDCGFTMGKESLNLKYVRFLIVLKLRFIGKYQNSTLLYLEIGNLLQRFLAFLGDYLPITFHEASDFFFFFQ